jgi:hypothetical protein
MAVHAPSDLEIKGRNLSSEINERVGLLPNELNIQGGYQPETSPIYIYNIAPLEWGEAQGLKRAPNHPHLYMKPCPADKDYIQVGSITHPFPTADFDSNGVRFVRWENGYIEASRMLNPENPGIDQNWDSNGGQFRHPKGNLNAYGIFWSVNNPPLPEELAAARARLEKTFKNELKVVADAEASGVPLVQQSVVTRTAHAAAEYFSKNGEPLNFSWHRTDLRVKNEMAGKIECPNCAELINPKAATCRFCEAVIDEKRAKELFPDRFAKAGRDKKETTVVA